MRKLLILLFISFIIFSCKTTTKVSNSDETENICESMTYTVQQLKDLTTDYYTIDTLFISDNCLNIWVSYGGGCGDADFTLFYNNKVMRSMPPQTTLHLQLIDNDPCRAIVQQKLYYNLSFFDEYKTQKGIIFNFSDTGKSIAYKK